MLEVVNDMELMGVDRATTVLYLYKTGRGCTEALTQKQCAEVIGSSRQSVDETIDRALIKIKEALDDE